MATIRWPATLPKAPTVARYAETLPDLSIRSQVEAGPAKVRQRITANVAPVEIELKLTGAQVVILRTFWTTTTAGGSLAFQWIDHATGADADYRFISPPQLRPLSPRIPGGPLGGSPGGAEYWSATFQLERMPFVTPATTDAGTPDFWGGLPGQDQSLSALDEGPPAVSMPVEDDRVFQEIFFVADAAEPAFYIDSITQVYVGDDGQRTLEAGGGGGVTTGTTSAPALERSASSGEPTGQWTPEIGT
jgi:hypothetical protein